MPVAAVRVASSVMVDPLAWLIGVPAIGQHEACRADATEAAMQQRVERGGSAPPPPWHQRATRSSISAITAPRRTRLIISETGAAPNQ
jgi:hypothetical protein